MVDTTQDNAAQLGLLAADPAEVCAASEREAQEYLPPNAVAPLSREEAETLAKQIRQHVGSVRALLLRMDEGKGWKALGYGSWRQWAAKEFEGSERSFYQELQAAKIETEICANAQIGAIPEGVLRPLGTLKDAQDRRAVWRLLTLRVGRENITGPLVAESVERWIAERERGELVLTMAPEAKNPIGTARLNRTNENVDWAWWTWNPVTGCLHDCAYCYARDIANRFYPQGFQPTFLPERLKAPHNTPVPDGEDDRSRRIFTCSMADLFGKWVPQEWIDAVFAEVRDNPQWEFLFLTKFPQRLAEIEWPDNAWVGTTVDRQYRVPIAEKAFRGVKAGVKWLSCEPLLEPLKFTSLEMFDLVVIGGCSRSSQTEEFWPPQDWIADLHHQARAAGCKIFYKHNAVSRDPGQFVRQFPRESPR